MDVEKTGNSLIKPRGAGRTFDTILEIAGVGMALLDRNGRVAVSNAALERLLGLTKEALRDNYLLSFTCPDRPTQDQERVEAVIAGEQHIFQQNRCFRDVKGNEHWCELTVSQDPQSNLDEDSLAVAVIIDETEKLLAQRTLLRTERLAIAGRLGATLAHEINNPLQSAIGCLGLAHEMLDEQGEVREYLEIAMQELERTAGIVWQLHDLSRVPRKHKIEPVDLNALLEKVLKLTKPQCLERKVDVVWTPIPGSPVLNLARDRMQQVFLNLMLNAIEAMSTRGRLTVRGYRKVKPHGISLVFEDNGVGIPPDRLENIFEPFHSTRPEGLGLGLYISKRIVEQHGGTISVRSQVGKGTVFTIWLPS